MECKEDNVFTKLNKINMIIEQSKTFLGLMIINFKTIMDIFDDIYASLPEEIEMFK